MAITDALCRSFLDLWWHFDPAAATSAGAPGHDGRLGSFDPDAVREHVAALRSIAGAVEDLEIEDIADEIERTALLDHLRVLLFRLEREHPYRRNPALWIEHACIALDGLLVRPADDTAAALSALDRLRDLPRFLTAARDTLRDPPLVLVEAAHPLLAGLAVLIGETRAHFAPLWTALDELEAQPAVSAAEAAVHRTGQALRTEIAPDAAPGAEAIGEDEVDRRLHHEHASVYNGAEIWRAANRLAAETEAEVESLSADIAPGRPWRDVYEDLRDETPASDAPAVWEEAMLASARIAEGIGFDLERLPPLAVGEAPDYARVLEPDAAYCPAGPRTVATVRLAAPDPAATGWLAARLGVPGAHLHRARMEEQPGLVRRHIAAGSTTSGWGLYATLLLKELEYDPDPVSRLAERVLALRDARLAVADLGMHNKQLTAETATTYLITHLPITRDTVLADVRRLASRPTSAAAAILGRQELVRLRDEVRDVRGSAFSYREFHDEVLGYGGLPVPLIRWGMGMDG